MPAVSTSPDYTGISVKVADLAANTSFPATVTSSVAVGVNNWKEKTKKSWFSKSISNQTSPIDDETAKMLNQYVRSTSTLLKEFTGGIFTLPARTYNKRTLIDEGFGGALIAGVMQKKFDKALSFGGNEGELEKTYRYWMEQAKKDKKETYELLAEYVGKINSNIKSLKLENLSNAMEKLKFAKDEAIDALKTLNSGLGAFSNDFDTIGQDMAKQIEKAYREALKTDFTKESVDRYNALIEAYKQAKKAQDEFTSALMNFSAQIASTQANFYQAHGIDSSFIGYQNLYTKFRMIAGELERDMSASDRQGITQKGDIGNINSWAKYFLSMNAAQMQEFLSSGNTYEEYKLSMLRMANEIEGITRYATLDTINKSIKELEDAIAKQNKTIEEQAEKLRQASEKQLSSLDNQLATLEAQRKDLINAANSQINRMGDLLGKNSPIVKYLIDMLEALKKGQAPKYQENKPDLPNYTTPDNINNGYTTANGAIVKTELEKFINQTYLSALGRSVEQGGLDYWKDMIQKGLLPKEGLATELIKAMTRQTGSSNKNDWIEWYKARGAKPFADGGIVTRPTRALIGEAGYNEAVIPLKDGRGVKVDMDGAFSKLIARIEKGEKVSEQIAGHVKDIAFFIRNTMSKNGDALMTEVVR